MYATTKIVKIAASAAISVIIPTRPRVGSSQGRSGPCVVIGVAFISLPPSLVSPIRILRVLEIPERAPAPDSWDLSKVVCRRRRSCRPFECPGVPWIASGAVTFEIRPEQVTHEDQNSGGLKDHTDRRKKIPDIPAPPGLVGIDSSRHPQQSRDMHQVKREVKSDQEQPEVQLPQPLV